MKYADTDCEILIQKQEKTTLISHKTHSVAAGISETLFPTFTTVHTQKRRLLG